jgi:hypothetical protein
VNISMLVKFSIYLDQLTIYGDLIFLQIKKVPPVVNQNLVRCGKLKQQEGLEGGNFKFKVKFKLNGLRQSLFC